jgi:hypothetical protein
MRPEPHLVAARLGFDQSTIRRLQAHGHPSRLKLTEPEIHERLSISRPKLRTGDLTLQHPKLVTQNEDLDLLRPLRPHP